MCILNVMPVRYGSLSSNPFKFWMILKTLGIYSDFSCQPWGWKSWLSVVTSVCGILHWWSYLCYGREIQLRFKEFDVHCLDVPMWAELFSWPVKIYPTQPIPVRRQLNRVLGYEWVISSFSWKSNRTGPEVYTVEAVLHLLLLHHWQMEPFILL